MNLIGQLSAIVILIVYLSGLAAGVLGCAVYASVLEDRDATLLGRPPDPVTAGVRVMLGFFARDDGYLVSLLPHGEPMRQRHGREPGQ